VAHVVADLVAAVVSPVHAVLAIVRGVVPTALAIIRDLVSAILAIGGTLVLSIADAVLAIGRAVTRGGAITHAVLGTGTGLAALGKIQKSAQVALRRRFE